MSKAKADHDFVEQELELKSNTELTRVILTLVRELDGRLVARDQGPQQARTPVSVEETT